MRQNKSHKHTITTIYNKFKCSHKAVHKHWTCLLSDCHSNKYCEGRAKLQRSLFWHERRHNSKFNNSPWLQATILSLKFLNRYELCYTYFWFQVIQCFYFIAVCLNCLCANITRNAHFTKCVQIHQRDSLSLPLLQPFKLSIGMSIKIYCSNNFNILLNPCTEVKITYFELFREVGIQIKLDMV